MSDIDLTQFPDTLQYDFNGNEQRAKVFLDRYALRGPDGSIVETRVDEMWSRVARGIAGDPQDLGIMPSDLGYKFYHLLEDFKFVPGGRILSGAGTGTEVTFYNCYVIPVETKNRRQVRTAMAETGEPIEHWDTDEDTGSDSREAIIDTIGVMVDIMTRGGGVGINWSVLRPAGTHLKRINATSSGPIDWMHLASTAVGTVEQGGSRRGAAMFMLDDWHPDVLRFIDAKRDLTRITNANVSVAVSDEFMKRVKEDGVWNFVFPNTEHPAYDTEWDGDIVKWTERHNWEGNAIKLHGSIRARDLWRKLAESAWDNGEPGVVFLDRYNKQSTGLGVERIISVNPCGEQGLGAYSVCNLGSMNLAKYVRPNTPIAEKKGDWEFDWSSFEQDVETAVRFMDRVIDQNHYFLPENEKVQKDLRRIGLGVMGLADALIGLQLRYGTQGAVDFTEEVFRRMKDVAIETSAALARELGPAPAWDDDMWNRPYLADYYDRHGWVGLGSAYDGENTPPLRNLFLLTQAPTGTTSILAGVSSGIEPLFALGFWREDRTGKHWVEPQSVIDHRAIDGYCDDSCGFLATANDVTFEEHVAMQAAAQKYIDSSISKTINAPNSHTIEDVEAAYSLAYRSGLKGLAYFRDGCGRAQVLSTETPQNTSAYNDEFVDSLVDRAADLAVKVEALQQERDELAKQPGPFARPDVLMGRTHKVRAGTQTAYVTVNRTVADPPMAVEVFVSVGKSGTGMMEMGEAMGRLASIGLQKGLTLEDLIDQLDGVGNNGMLNRSLPSAIAQALKADIEAEAEDVAGAKEFIGSFVARDVEFSFTAQMSEEAVSAWGPETEEWERPADDPIIEEQVRIASYDICPDCGAMALAREEGCKKCMACGYSAC